MVLNHKMSQVTDVVEENQEPIADQVITMEPKLNLSFCSVVHIEQITVSDFIGNL
jgi:hypothetical protein